MDPVGIGLLVFLTKVIYEANYIFFYSFCLVIITENGSNCVDRIAGSQ